MRENSVGFDMPPNDKDIKKGRKKGDGSGPDAAPAIDPREMDRVVMEAARWAVSQPDAGPQDKTAAIEARKAAIAAKVADHNAPAFDRFAALKQLEKIGERKVSNLVEEYMLGNIGDKELFDGLIKVQLEREELSKDVKKSLDDALSAWAKQAIGSMEQRLTSEDPDWEKVEEKPEPAMVAPAPAEAPAEKAAKIIEKESGETELLMLSYLKDVREFNQQVYANALKFLKLIEAGRTLTDEQRLDLARIGARIKASELFKPEGKYAGLLSKFAKQQFGGEIGSRISHDLAYFNLHAGNDASILVQTILDGDQDNLPADLKNFCASWPLNAGVSEDLFVSYLAEKGSSDAQKFAHEYNSGLEAEQVGRAARGLADQMNSRHAEYLRRKKLGADGEQNPKYPEVKFFGDQDVLENQAIFGDSAKLVNLLSNIVRNACTYRGRKGAGAQSKIDLESGIDANNVKIFMERQGNELVVQVVDDGIGIDKALLDPASPKFIFKTGVSGRGGSGIGLGSPESIRGAGIKLEVVSRPRGTSPDQAQSFSNDESASPESRGKLANILDQENASTIFELRIPMVAASSSQRRWQRAQRPSAAAPEALTSAI